MAVTNFLVNSLPAYVQTNQDIIVRNFALVGGGTRAKIGLQTGIKSSAYLNYLDLAPELQDGAGCGFNPLDSITISQRTLETALIKVDGEICPESLVGKYAEYLVRIAATENDLPFEEYILRALTDEINKKIEKLIWLGDKTSQSADLKWIDGFVTMMTADQLVVKKTIASGSTALQGINQVYAAMTDEAVERGGVIFVSNGIYRLFLMGLVNANLFHYSGPQDEAPMEYILPGTNVRVISTPGLSGDLNIVGTFADNLVYGCDGEGDNESVDLWWSQDNRTFRYQVKWNSGVQYRYPEQVVLGTFAAAPTA